MFKRWPPIIVTTGRIQCFRGFRSTDFLFTFNLPFHSELSSTDFVLMLTKWLRHFSLLSVKQPFLLLLYFYFCLYPDTDIKIFYFLSPFLFIFNTFLDRNFRQKLLVTKISEKKTIEKLFLGEVVDMKWILVVIILHKINFVLEIMPF